MPLSQAVLLARISHEQAHRRDLVAEVGRDRTDEPGLMGAHGRLPT